MLLAICLPLIAGFFYQKDCEVHPSLEEQKVELFLTDSLLAQVPNWNHHKRLKDNQLWYGLNIWISHTT